MAQGYKTGGRKPGSVNKITANVRTAIANAFDAVGGEAYLIKLAAEDPRTFVALLGKIVPTQHEGGDPDNPIKSTLEVSWKSADE